MKELIMNYWLEFILAGLGTALLFILKNHYSLIRKDLDGKFHDQVEKKITENNEVLREELRREVERSETSDNNLRCEVETLSANMENLTAGVLSIQGKTFKDDCRALLVDGHVITMDEYEDIEEEHEAYHALGGNHKGDALYKSVMKKWNAQITMHPIQENEGDE